jgi:hypothetical protein
MVKGVLGIDVMQITAGDMHTAMLFNDGRIMMCGSSPVVPPIIYSNVVNHDDENFQENKSSYNDLVDLEVDTFRFPSSMWLPGLSSRRIVDIFSGASRMYAVLEEDSIASSLFLPLYNKLFKETSLENSVQKSTNDVDDDADSATVVLSNESIIDMFDKRGQADCMIIAGGKILFSHRAILTQRSPVLRDLIEDEVNAISDPSENAMFQPVQILLPQLQYSTAKELLYFIYTDKISSKCVTDISLIKSLERAADNFRMVSY